MNKENIFTNYYLIYDFFYVFIKIMVAKTKKKSNYINYFVPHSRLSPLQRKYCKCLMSVRPTLKDDNKPYGICYNSIKKWSGMSKKKKLFYKKLNPKNVNCVMNYNYNMFTADEIKALAKELKIPTTYIKEGKRVPYNKSTLIVKITKYYIDKRIVKKKKRSKRKQKTRKLKN